MEVERKEERGMRTHPSARQSPLSGHVFSQALPPGCGGYYASDKTLMAEALRKS